MAPTSREQTERIMEEAEAKAAARDPSVPRTFPPMPPPMPLEQDEEELLERLSTGEAFTNEEPPTRDKRVYFGGLDTDRKLLAPESGYNVIAVDSFGPTPRLFFVAHCEVLWDAFSIAGRRADNARVYDSYGREREPHDFCGGVPA